MACQNRKFLPLSRALITIYSATILFILSTIAILINVLIYHFPGNNYFPPHTIYLFLSLILMHYGFLLQFGQDSQLAKITKEVIYFFLVMSLLALATNAAQYTPFSIIDPQILALENYLHIDMKAIISWTQSKPLFKTILAFIYDTLPYQMAYIPLFVIVTKRWRVIHEYYFLFIFSALLGFTFYYFFPTTAPASVIQSPYFDASQHATGLKFNQIHQYIPPTTMTGGMVALPSFHVIWAWFCLYLLWSWKYIFILLLPVNLLLIASCVLLGWHYPIDILGGVLIIFCSHSAYRISANCHML